MDDSSLSLDKALKSHRLAEAKNLSRHYVLIAAGLSLVPLPIIDIAAVLALQAKMVRDIAQLYQRPIQTGLMKPLLLALLSGGSISGGGLLVIGLGTSFPVLRTLIGGGYTGSLAGMTFATSEIFIRHFEAGGTIDTIEDAVAVTTLAAEHHDQSSVQKQFDSSSNSHDSIDPDIPGNERLGSNFSVAMVKGIGSVYTRRLEQAGIADLRSFAELQPDVVQAILGSRVSLAAAQDFIAQARTLLQVNSS
jgi:uncharacterized protein (DUF697 family)